MNSTSSLASPCVDQDLNNFCAGLVVAGIIYRGRTPDFHPTLMIVTTTRTTTTFVPKTLRRPRYYAFFLLIAIGMSQWTVHQTSIQILSLDSFDRTTAGGESDFDFRRSAGRGRPGGISHRYASSVEAYMPTLSTASRPLTPHINTTRSRAVFYNIYIPFGGEELAMVEEGQNHALGIVKEQLALKQSSTLLKNVPLYYTVIGSNMTEEISQMCESYHDRHQSDEKQSQQQSQNCHLLQYSPQGDEALTLQSIHDYCLDHPHDQITYIHNKGSFHPSEKNEKFRIFVNQGVLGRNGKVCQEMPLNQLQEGGLCNVCGTRFATFPHYHMAGNMWTATCQYVRQLIRPLDFPTKMEALLEQSIFLGRTSGVGTGMDGSIPEATTATVGGMVDPVIPKPTFQQYSDGYPVGRDRYSLEHWIGSHPYLQPCDIYSRKYTHGYRDLPSIQSVWTAHLATAPRFDIHTFLKISSLRGEWYCGQARLWEYAYLYDGLQPDPDHFVWKYYRDIYKGCNVPLDYRRHNNMFLAKLYELTNHSNSRATLMATA